MYRLDQTQTPLFDALLEYVQRDTVPFHVPGHKRGTGAYHEFKKFIGENPFNIDVTVFKLVDNLHHPKGPIKKAQELAADAYGSDAAFFSLNGTSGAIQAMILSVVNSGDKILIPRNVHKSITAGIILSGAVPIYMQPEIDTNVGIAHGVSPSTVEDTLKKHPDARAVLIINPTYYGVATDITSIAQIVHRYNIPLIVDEAHGPHLKFNDRLPISGMEAGADICAQSTHKIIGSLTQSSMLHVRSNLVDIHRVHQVLNLLQTTSPSYILMASLDCARKQIALHGRQLTDHAIDLANYAREEINKISGLYCFGREIIGNQGVYALDPTKITINCRGLGISGYELEMLLSDNYHVQVELSDLYNVLAVGSFGDTEDSINSLINALREISSKHSKVDNKIEFFDIPATPKQVLIPREAFNSIKSSVPLDKSIGMISGEFILAYPPGIPILCPGEKITSEVIDYVHKLKQANLYVQGTEDPNVENIKVVDEEDAVIIDVK